MTTATTTVRKDIWAEHPHAIKCYRLYNRAGRLEVYDCDDAAYIAAATLFDVLDFIGAQVWPTLEAFCADKISGDSYASSIGLRDAIAEIGVDVSELDTDTDTDTDAAG